MGNGSSVVGLEVSPLLVDSGSSSSVKGLVVSDGSSP